MLEKQLEELKRAWICNRDRSELLLGWVTGGRSELDPVDGADRVLSKRVERVESVSGLRIQTQIFL